MSLADLARAVHYSKSHLSKVENGIKSPGSDLARLCDVALNASGELAHLAAVPATPSLAMTEHSAAEELIVNLSPDGSTQIAAVSRRNLLTAGVATAATWVLVPPRGAVRYEPRLLQSFRQILAELRQAGQTASPATLAPVAAAQIHALESMATNANSGMRDELRVLAAHYAMFVGWMAQESGNEDWALMWTRRGSGLAEAAQNSELVSYALVRQALVALYRHDAIGTVAPAQHAQTLTASWRVRGLAALREAQGHAIAGDDIGCHRALERAANWLDRAQQAENNPVIGTSTLADPVSMVTGWCLHELGRPTDAAEVLARECTHIAAGASRAQARFRARWALSLALANEIEQACMVAESVLVAVEECDSATVRSDLRRLAQTLNRYGTLPEVRFLSPRLAAALHGAR